MTTRNKNPQKPPVSARVELVPLATLACLLEPRFLRQPNANAYFIPPMMLTRSNHSVAIEDPIKCLQPSIPSTSIRRYPVLNSIIRRLGNSLFALIVEPDQPLVLNCGVKQMVQFLIDCHRLTSSASYLSTSSLAAESTTYPPPQTQTSAHRHPAQNTPSSSSANSCHPAPGSPACNALRAIHPSFRRPGR